MAGAHQMVHLHVLARNVIDDRRHGALPAAHRFFEGHGILAVGDDLALISHAYVHVRRPRRDAVVRVLLEAGGGVHRGFAFQSPIMRPSGSVNSANLPMPGTFCSSTWILPPAASTFFRYSVRSSTRM